MVKNVLTFSLFVMLAAPALAQSGAPDAGPPVYRVEIVKSYPHDRGAFTQGLLVDNGQLYESTGQYGESTIRQVDLKTGKTLRYVTLDRQLFGEGLVVHGDRLIMLTWKKGRAIVCDKRTLQFEKAFAYDGEGWGLTGDDKRLIMSDGTDTLRILDPETFRVVNKVRVTDRGRPVRDLNELELIDGLLFANVWKSDWIAVIDPGPGENAGKVVAWIDLRPLYPARVRSDPTNDVLNGIAYDAKTRQLYVTGKNWPRLYEIRLIDPRTRRPVMPGDVGNHESGSAADSPTR